MPLREGHVDDVANPFFVPATCRRLGVPYVVDEWAAVFGRWSG
jgi:hypothetical protein